jgi:hypothetical protein
MAANRDEASRLAHEAQVKDFHLLYAVNLTSECLTVWKALIVEAEEESEHDQAIYKSIKAAETAIQAFHVAFDNDQRSEMKRTLDELLTRAEAIKSATIWPPASVQPLSAVGALALRPASTARPSRIEASLGPREEPQSTRELTQSEQILLLRNSKLHGFKFPPWKSAPEPKHFLLKEGDFGEAEQYVDSPDMRLSAKQQTFFAGWKRAAEALPPPSLLADGGLATMRSDRPLDLVQDAATDCSVVASLCAAVEREEKGHDKLLYKTIYPHDSQKQELVFSENGKYIVHLNFNGSYRYVTIDDRLPVSKTRRMLHILDKNNPSLIWPALLEKAYLKARGGYDFPGSNPGTDLWMLLGWIPEQVLLHDEETEINNVWKLVKERFQQGQVLLTAGTGTMTRRTERGLGLASRHAYAILDLKEENNQKLLLLKNPWSAGSTLDKTASGRPNGINGDRAEEETLISWDGTETTFVNTPSPEPQGPAATKPASTFWMNANEILQHFESLYLNWDSRLFSYRQDIHFSWNYGVAASSDSPADKPQFVVHCASGPLWLLLCRHFNSRDALQSENSLLLDSDVKETNNVNGFISLDVYDNGGGRAQTNINAIKQSPYVDSPQTLVKLESVQNRPYTVVVRGKDLPYGEYGFSLSAFSIFRISLSKVATEYKFTTTVSSAWNAATAGGNSESSNYFINPQFQVSILQKADLFLLLEGPDVATNVNLKLVHSSGNRVFKMPRQDIIKDSGDYRPGSATALIQELDPGKYTIICSTFQAGQEGPFTLRIQSTVKVEIVQLPSELAGRFLIDKLPVAVFYPKMEKMAMPIVPKKIIKITAMAKLKPPTTNSLQTVQSRSPLRLSIELKRMAYKQIHAVSGDGKYEDSSVGIRTTDVYLTPDMRRMGDLWIVLDRLAAPAGGEVERFQVDLLADGQLGRDFEVGQWRQWDD